MGFDVKKTTKWGVLDWLCPHYCMGCGRLGEPICGCCKNDILVSNLQFRKNYLEVLMVGRRSGLLGEVVKRYKYGPTRALSGALADLMKSIIDGRVDKSEKIVLVPLPTIARHIRQRGFDHMWLLGRKLARLGGWRVERVLERRNDTVQVGQDKETRVRQAEEAYRAVKRLDRDKLYVLLDDVWTTGASMRAAAEELRKAGAQKIKIAVVAISEND